MTKNTGSTRTGMPATRKCGAAAGLGHDHGRFLPCPRWPASPPPSALPEGEEKVAAVRAMFDAIAPRYDLVNRIMTFRMDVRLAAPHGRPLGLAARRHRPRPRLRHRRPVPRAGQAGAAPDRRRPVASACWPPPAPRPRCVQGDVLRLPRPRRLRRRGHLRVRPPQLRGLPPVLRRAGPGGATRRADRAARGGRAAEPAPALRARHLLRQGRAARSAACCPTPPPTATSPARSPTCPSREVPRPAGRRRVRRRRAPAALGRHRPADHGHPHRRRHPRREPAPAGLVARTRRLAGDARPARRWPGATACSTCDGRWAWPAGAWRPASRSPMRAALLATIEVDDEVGRPGHGPGGLRRAALPPRPGRRAGGARGRVGRRRRRHPWVTTIGPDRRRAADLGDARCLGDAAGRAVGVERRCRTARVVVRPGRPRHRPSATPAPTGCRRWCWPARCSSRPTRRSTVAASCARLRDAYPDCFVFHVDGFLGASPELLVGRTATWCGPSRWPAPRPGGPTRTPTPSWPPRCWRRPPTATSTRSRSTWCTTRCCRGAPTSTTRPSRRSSAWPTCSTWPPSWRAGCRSRRRRCSSSCRPSTPPRRCAAGRGPRRGGGSRSTRASTAAATPGTVGWVDARRQRHVGRQHPLRRGPRHHGPRLRRQRHRGRQRPRHRAGRDRGQAQRHARRAALSRPCASWTRTRRRTSVVGSASVGEPTSTPTRSPAPHDAELHRRLDGVPHDLVGGAVRVHHHRADAPGHAPADERCGAAA